MTNKKIINIQRFTRFRAFTLFHENSINSPNRFQIFLGGYRYCFPPLLILIIPSVHTFALLHFLVETLRSATLCFVGSSRIVTP